MIRRFALIVITFVLLESCYEQQQRYAPAFGIDPALIPTITLTPFPQPPSQLETVTDDSESIFGFLTPSPIPIFSPLATPTATRQR